MVLVIFRIANAQYAQPPNYKFEGTEKNNKTINIVKGNKRE